MRHMCIRKNNKKNWQKLKHSLEERKVVCGVNVIDNSSSLKKKH